MLGNRRLIFILIENKHFKLGFDNLNSIPRQTTKILSIVYTAFISQTSTISNQNRNCLYFFSLSTVSSRPFPPAKSFASNLSQTPYPTPLILSRDKRYFSWQMIPQKVETIWTSPVSNFYNCVVGEIFFLSPFSVFDIAVSWLSVFMFVIDRRYRKPIKSFA